MKKGAVAFVIALFLFVAFAIVYIFSELYTESEAPEEVVTDAMKFEEEYEAVNGNEQGDYKIRELNIGKKNPFIYKTEDELVKLIEDKKTFVVYFGFAECPWCRSVLPSLIQSAKENDIDTIYYVNVKNIRDKYELNENNEAVRTVEGTEGYYRLLELFEPVLADYEPLTYTTKKNKTKKVTIDEKRIYAPNVVVVKNGNAMSLEIGMVDELTDPYMELTDALSNTIKCRFDCILETVNEDNATCSVEDHIC